MADAFQRGANVRNNIVLFGSVELSDFIDDGTTQAIESRRIREAGEPVQGTGRFGCRGEPAGDIVEITHRVLRGSPTDQFLRTQLNADATTYSYTPRGLAAGLVNSRWFSDCAYVEGGDAGPVSGGDKIVEYLVYAVIPINNDLNIV